MTRKRQHQEVVQHTSNTSVVTLFFSMGFKDTEVRHPQGERLESVVFLLVFYRFNSIFIFAGVEQVRGTRAQNTQRDEPHLELCVSDCLPCVAPGRSLSKSSFHKCQDQATAVTAWLAPAGGAGTFGAKQRQPSQRKSKLMLFFK